MRFNDHGITQIINLVKSNWGYLRIGGRVETKNTELHPQEAYQDLDTVMPGSYKAISNPNGETYSTTSATTSSGGWRVSFTKAVLVYKIEKESDCTATHVDFCLNDNSVVDTAEFVGDIATFSPPLAVDADTGYKIKAHKQGNTYTRKQYNPDPNEPIEVNDVVWVGGVSANTNTSTRYNLVDIYTAEPTPIGLGLQCAKSGKLYSVTKHTDCTATRARFQTDLGVDIATAEFVGDIARFDDGVFVEESEEYLLVLDAEGDPYDSVSGATGFPLLNEYLNITSGYYSVEDDSNAYNILAIDIVIETTDVFETTVVGDEFIDPLLTIPLTSVAVQGNVLKLTYEMNVLYLNGAKIRFTGLARTFEGGEVHSTEYFDEFEKEDLIRWRWVYDLNFIR